MAPLQIDMTLTSEQIDTMEAGPDMDALVAEKVMGWKPHIRGGLKNLQELPATPYPYSTEIAAAWLVVENLGGAFKLEYVPADDFGDGMYVMTHWECEIETEVGEWVKAEATTAPLAICRAALKSIL